MKFLWLALVAVAVGCATTTPKEAAPSALFRTVRLESAPPGARVFIAYGVTVGKATQEEYLATTPGECRVAANSDGTFEIKPHIAFASKFGAAPVAVIIARSGTNEQRRIYHKAAFGREGDKIPGALFFDFETR